MFALIDNVLRSPTTKKGSAGENPDALERTGLDVRSHAPAFDDGEVEGRAWVSGGPKGWPKKDRPFNFEVDQIQCASMDVTNLKTPRVDPSILTLGAALMN